MDPALRLQPGQQSLTPAQEAEAWRFAEEAIRRQLSTEPVDEQEAEALLRQAYQVIGLTPPQRIQWVDGPLQLVAALTAQSLGASVRASDSFYATHYGSGWSSIRASLEDSVGASVKANVGASVWGSIAHVVKDNMWLCMLGSIPDNSVGYIVRANVGASVGYITRDSVRKNVSDIVWAYLEADWLAFYQFFAVYLGPNDLHALACFNQMVSGYWLGQEVALVVRRPRLLCRDEAGRLHNETGKCIEYHDGWGLYAWHGVRVPERVILAPETLTRDDFLNEPNIEMRRVIQDRMGQRFVPELGGVVLDSGQRGTLYEVALPEDDLNDDSNNDPERVARYVQVQDASTERQYFLRVPPTIQTAAEAVAWSFNMSVEDYHPAQET